ncbi:hypothetical protein ACH41E_34545 [Streptomyces sp. NPDC020412]|uniref:hypothetical protein n=1 Tax=Streptomyces sp. NPDC020412 TaxID=3365073 RepID=UPI0037873EDC
MSDPNGTTGSGSYVPPNGWGGTSTNDLTETTTDSIPSQRDWMADRVRIPFPNTELYEIPDEKELKQDGTKWVKTYTLTRSGPERSLRRNLVIPGTVQVEAIYQPAELTEFRTKSKTSESNLNYTLRIDLGDASPEPIVGTVSDEDMMAMGNKSGRWVRKLEVQHFIHSRQYQSLKYVVWAKARAGLQDGSLRKEEVFNELGMFRAIEPDPKSDGERYVFLTPGTNGALAEDGWEARYKAELPVALQDNARVASFGYCPAKKERLKESLAELLKLYGVTPKHPWIGAGLLGTTGLAPMYGVHRSAQVALAIVGPTKQGKTTLAKLVLPNQSPTERGGSTIEPTINARSVKNGSTAWGIAKATSHLGGFSVVIDDMITPQHMLPMNAKLLRDAVGNIETLVSKINGGGAIKGGGFDPDTKEAKLQKFTKPKASLILTLEDFPRTPEYESVFNRMVVMTHESKVHSSLDVLQRLWSEESEGLRFNAQCHYVQELMRDAELFDSAWKEAGEITDRWEFADFERERDNYRRLLTGNIALLKVAKKVGVKTPSVEMVAGWLYEAAKLQEAWGVIETEAEENDPLNLFRVEYYTQLSSSNLGTYTAPNKTADLRTITYPEIEDLGPLEWHHLGYYANPGQEGVDDEADSENLYPSKMSVYPLKKGAPVGLFIAHKGGRRPPKFVRRFEYTTAEFDRLYLRMEEGLKRRGKGLPSKVDFLRLAEAANVGQKTKNSQGKPVVQINADWLSQVGDFA